MSEEFIQRLSNLTSKQELYFRVMYAQYGVLYITAKPGVAKSAIAKEIAEVMGLDYIDLRLSMNDETDFKFPYLSDEEYNGEKIKVSNYAVPKWAYKANTRPTLVHFEELNRAPQFVRNAALQILLEREIGEFKFNDNVYMMASGNLGSEDNTDVEEFDAALNNRLIHYKHELAVDEWLNDYAKTRVHNTIVSFIEVYPNFMYQDIPESAAYYTPRSWTMLSKFIEKNWGLEAETKDFINYIQKLAPSYVGAAGARKYIQYCENMLNINIKDIIDNYPDIKKELVKYNRDKYSELLNSLKSVNISILNEKQLKNVIEFLKNISPDELTGYLLSILSNKNDIITEPNINKLLLSFEDILNSIYDIIDNKK